MRSILASIGFAAFFLASVPTHAVSIEEALSTYTLWKKQEAWCEDNLINRKVVAHISEVSDDWAFAIYVDNEPVTYRFKANGERFWGLPIDTVLRVFELPDEPTYDVGGGMQFIHKVLSGKKADIRLYLALGDKFNRCLGVGYRLVS